MKRLFNILFLFLSLTSFSQNRSIDSARVLFIGNSYTGVNNLPQLFSDVSASAGKYVYIDSNTPGGYTFQMHNTDVTTIAKIMQGGFDYVVLQAQSQEPSFPYGQFITSTYPYALSLDNLIKQYNPCAQTVFYMTWGRKNGDASNCASFPPLCTYEGMDSLLHLRYCLMADSIDALVSPVGAAWHYVRDNDPTLELYQSDESHPSMLGSYLAACCFYSTIFRSNPTQITYNSVLNPNEAMYIQNAVKTVVYDSLMKWNIGKFDPIANFIYTAGGNNTANFTNQSANAVSYLWNFGDGSNSVLSNPSHTYALSGSHNVTLKAINCNRIDSLIKQVTVISTGINDNVGSVFNLSPNPANVYITLEKSAISKDETISIYNMHGQLFMQHHIYKTFTTIDISRLSKGLYLILLNSDNNVAIKKFIKE